MSEYKETVTTTEDKGVDESGSEVRQKTRHIDTNVSTDSKSVATNLIWFITGTIGVLLGLRFVFKLLGANPSSGIVDFVYGVTNVLTAPFDNIFGVASTSTENFSSVFEPSIIVAGLVYLLIGWGLVKLLNVNQKV